MSEEEFTRYDEKELFEELSKNKDRRSNILINLNVSLQRACSFVANIKDVRELQEYKSAIISVESELQKVEKEKQELIDYLNNQIKHLDNLINKSKPKPYGEELNLYENSKLRYLEILSKIEKR